MTTQEMLNYSMTALDQLNSKIEGYLDNQYNKGRIKGTEYAQVYAQLISTAIQTTMGMGFSANQQESETKLKDQQTEVAKKQVKSFDQDVKMKLFKAQMDTFAMIYSSNPDAEEIPDVLKKSNVNALYDEINNSVRI